MAAEVKLEKKEDLHHPWNLHSIYDLQYFCCPECTYKVSSSTIHGKQDLINHAYESHPNSVDFLNNIQDGSLCDVVCPWTDVKDEPFAVAAASDFDLDENLLSDPGSEYLPSDEEIIVTRPQRKKSQKRTKTSSASGPSKKIPKKDNNTKDNIILNNIISCDICDNLQFQSIEELSEHLEKVHPELKLLEPQKCEFCEMTFYFLKLLEVHVEQNHNENGTSNNKKQNSRQNKCALCDWNGIGMKRHWNECHSGEKLPFACDECDVRKHSKATLISHKKKWHKPRKMQKCDMCDFQTDHTATMTRHLRCVHLNLKDFQCWKCPKTFKSNRSLNYHLVKAHEVVLSDREMVAVEKDLNKMNAHKLIPVDMQCKKCLKTDFDTILHLNAHVIDCYGPTLNKQVIFKCNKCETMWNSAEVLHYHLYSEHQVGDAVCDVCGTILKNIHYVKRHIDHVHRRVKNFQCDKCDARYQFKGKLKEHIEAVHLKIFKHQCEFCDFKAVIRSKLITHVKVKHTKNPVFACRHCDFVTHINKRLKEHVTKIHAPLKQKPKIIIE